MTRSNDPKITAAQQHQKEYADALHKPAFANGFEGDSWMAVWCATCAQDENTCPLIGVALLGRTPRAWILINPGGLYDRYSCSHWSPV